MTLAEVYAECNADPGEPLATPPGVIIGGPLLPGPVVARAALHAKIVADRAPRQRTTRTPLHPIEEAGRLRALPRPDMSLPALQRARLSLRRRPHDRPPARAHQRIKPQVPMQVSPFVEDLLGRATQVGETGSSPTAMSSGPRHPDRPTPRGLAATCSSPACACPPHPSPSPMLPPHTPLDSPCRDARPPAPKTANTESTTNVDATKPRTKPPPSMRNRRSEAASRIASDRSEGGRRRPRPSEGRPCAR